MKPILCTEFGISTGINDQSLEKAILERAEIRADKKAKDLLARLPTEAMDAAGEISEQFRQSLVGFLAQSFDGLRTEVGFREAAKEEDLRNTRARVRELEVELAARDQTISVLETSGDDRRETLVAKTPEVTDLRAKLDLQSRNATQADLMMEMIRQAVGSAITEPNRKSPTDRPRR